MKNFAILCALAISGLSASVLACPNSDHDAPKADQKTADKKTDAKPTEQPKADQKPAADTAKAPATAKKPDKVSSR